MRTDTYPLIRRWRDADRCTIYTLHTTRVHSGLTTISMSTIVNSFEKTTTTTGHIHNIVRVIFVFLLSHHVFICVHTVHVKCPVLHRLYPSTSISPFTCRVVEDGSYGQWLPNRSGSLVVINVQLAPKTDGDRKFVDTANESIVSFSVYKWGEIKNIYRRFFDVFSLRSDGNPSKDRWLFVQCFETRTSDTMAYFHVNFFGTRSDSRIVPELAVNECHNGATLNNISNNNN